MVVLTPYASKEHRDDPFVKVIYVGLARSHQAKMRHSGDELDGLEEWVKTASIACRWGERRAVARDEKRQRALVQAAKTDLAEVWEDAISVVFEAIGEEGGFTRTWDTTLDTAERTWQSAGLDGSPLAFDHLNYTDRHGGVHLSYRTALHAAAAFAATDPETVELHIRTLTEQLKAEGFQPGNRFAHEWLIRTGPTHALALSRACCTDVWNPPRHSGAKSTCHSLRHVRAPPMHPLRQLQGSGHGAEPWGSDTPRCTTSSFSRTSCASAADRFCRTSRSISKAAISPLSLDSRP